MSSIYLDSTKWGYMECCACAFLLSLRMSQQPAAALIAQVEKHVAKYVQIALRQREIVAELDRHGHDTKLPHRLLCQFEELLAWYIAERDQQKETHSESFHPD